LPDHADLEEPWPRVQIDDAVDFPAFLLVLFLASPAPERRVFRGTEEPELAVASVRDPSNEREARQFRDLGTDRFE
jgi:hypothetical protein